MTAKARDQSAHEWDDKDETGLRFEKSVQDVEYYRDVKPHPRAQLRRLPHARSRQSRPPAWSWTTTKRLPATTIANRASCRKPTGISRSTLRYITPLQSRTSLLTWKLFGRRTDGLANDAPWYHADSKKPSKPFQATLMPPAEAVAGTYVGPDGQKIKVAPLSDDDRRTLLLDRPGLLHRSEV